MKNNYIHIKKNKKRMNNMIFKISNSNLTIAIFLSLVLISFNLFLFCNSFGVLLEIVYEVVL